MTEMNWCEQEVGTGGVYHKGVYRWLRYKNIGWEIKVSINNLIKCT